MEDKAIETLQRVVEKTLEGLSTRRIAAQFSISKFSISKTFLNFKKYGCVEDLLPLGREGQEF